MKRSIPLLAAAAAAAFVAPAGAGEALISADTNRTGHIDIYAADTQGATATVYELVGARRVPIRNVTFDSETPVKIVDALTWSCTRRTRRLTADFANPDGSHATARYSVRTPSCRDRLTLRVPATAARRTTVALTVADGWGLGDVAPRLCVHPPTGRRSCRAVHLNGRRRATVHVLLTRNGAWGLDLALGRFHLRRTLTAGLGARPATPAARPPLLVTGDSTVQGIDSDLDDRLGNSVRIVRDWRPGSGISHAPDHWPAFAAREARRVQERLTVISVGANDGYPMVTPSGDTTDCCDAAWKAEYARRATLIMRSFARHGRGTTLWLTLPRPEDPNRARISSAVNASVEQAAAGVPGVIVVRVDRVLTPGWKYRAAMRYRGRRVRVRMADGIHLTPAGAAIATDLIVAALRRAS